MDERTNLTARLAVARATSTDQRGFTLLEIMIVLALIGLLMSAVGVAVWKKYRDGQIKAAQLEVRELDGEVGHFMVMKRRLQRARQESRHRRRHQVMGAVMG